MKTNLFRAVALPVLFLSVFTLSVPVVAAEVETPVAGHSAADSAIVDSTTTTDAVELQRLKYKHEEEMLSIQSGQNTFEGTYLPIIIVFICVGIPVIGGIFLACFRLKKESLKEKQAQEMLIELARNGQTITPDIVRSFMAESKKQNVTKVDENDPSVVLSLGIRDLFIGIGFIVAGLMVNFCIKDKIAVWFSIPAFIFLGKGIANIVRWRVMKNDTKKDAEA